MGARSAAAAALALSVVSLSRCAFAIALPGSFWHLTDIHMDAEYASCAAPNASQWGSYACDSPQALLRGALGFMKGVQPRPEFVVCTGDDPPHASWSTTTRTWVFEAVDNVTEAVAEAFEGVPVFPSLGNHASWPHDQQRPSGPMFNHTAWLWETLYAIPPETVRLGGYYAAEVPTVPGLVVVSLNTVLWYTANNATEADEDPAGQIAWLNKTLAAAEAGGRRALLVAHVPPGVDERSGLPHLRARFNRAYVSLLRRYASTVAAQLAGHEHSDSFRVGGPLLAPSLTPWRNHWDPRSLPNNPGLRLFSFAGPLASLDYVQYELDLSRAAREAGPVAPFREEYTASALFGGLRPGPAGDAARAALLASNLTAFDAYTAANLVGYPQAACRGACRATQLCAVRHIDLGDFDACVAAAGE